MACGMGASMLEDFIMYESVITCPHCGHSKEEAMPENACVVAYECTGCGVDITPVEGSCCVFCSYGTEKCPPRQKGEDCCAG